MPTAVWTGTLSFGLVAVPVRLVPATEPKDVRFHLYDRAGRRVRYERVVDPGPEGREEPEEPAASVVAPAHEREPEPEGPRRDTSDPTPGPIAWDELMRGRENEQGEVVMLSRDEIEQVRPQRSRSIDIEDFVDLADIDPVSFEKTYYAVPRSLDAAEAVRPAPPRDARGRPRRVGRFVLRTKPHLVAVRPMRDVLAVETLFFGDEVRDPTELVPGLDGVEVDDRELELALRLIETLKTEWDPAAYADTYRQELLRILSEKTPTKEAEPERPVPGEPSAVEELMAALRESVEAAKTKQQRKRTRSTKAG